MGLRCIAVYSDADAYAPHVKMADEAYHIGPAPARESYLDAEKILAVAKLAKAEAIHPGYGFLSENAEFAKQCEAAGIIFVGPPASAITAMGSKSNAKQLMEKANVPLIPGYHGTDQSTEAFTTAAKKIGFPVLLKAAAGGGGKGMRVVNNAKEMESALAAAKREGLSSFGDDYILLEKYLEKPRHVEIQVFSDKHNNHLYLYERDCSIQRRHQKIIEEAPAPGMTDSLRRAMGEAAVACAKAIGYVGAGTIEFLLDEDGHFYFMEMNTRLQVEHPVTEMITGLDLVEWQLRVAAGEAMPLTQEQIPLHGHAIEVRIYAEDPMHDFLPSIGTIHYLQQPLAQNWLRVDTGIETGSQISQYYDPMIAKLIVWGETRSQAILRLIQALAHYRVCGVQTNLALLARIACNPDYQVANLFTHFISHHHDQLFSTADQANDDLIVAAAIWHTLHHQNQLKQYANQYHQENSPWFIGKAWRMNMPAEQTLTFNVNNTIDTVNLIETPDGYKAKLNNQEFDVSIMQHTEHHLRISINQIQHDYTIVAEANHLTVFNQLRNLTVSLAQDKWETEDGDASGGHLRAPMPGTVTAILVKPEQNVKRGEALVIIEAMKMEHTINAPTDGIVREICYDVGDSVDEGSELVVVE
jgi:3-methylcrotonyl-CoA carboxylase alpha subunit